MKRILEEFAKDLLVEARRIMDSEVGINSKVGKNTLSDSDLYKQIEFDITDDGTINLKFNNYIVFVEWDRPREYKSPPPYKAILEWLKRKNIAPTNSRIKTVEQLAWAMRYNIWKNGWKGRPILATLFDNADNLWDERSFTIFDKITEQLTEYFNT